MNVRDTEISKVLYLFTQKDIQRDIYYPENSNRTFSFTFFWNKF